MRTRHSSSFSLFFFFFSSLLPTKCVKSPGNSVFCSNFISLKCVTLCTKKVATLFQQFFPKKKITVTPHGLGLPFHSRKRGRFSLQPKKVFQTQKSNHFPLEYTLFSNSTRKRNNPQHTHALYSTPLCAIFSFPLPSLVLFGNFFFLGD